VVLKIRNPKQFKTPFNDEGRECTACGEFKVWGEFSVHNRSASKRTSKCKACKKLDRPARDIKREKFCAKTRIEEIKKTDPLLHKARLLRQTCISRIPKDDLRRVTTPPVKEFHDWLLSQQPFTCYYSGEQINGIKFHVDHKKPLERGGTNEVSNLCIASPKMNTAKGGLSEEEFQSLLALVSTWEDKGERLFRRLRQGFY
jgi:5-methylcytosine-specific restriction endonuclease McrA